MSYKMIQLSKAADIIVGFPFASEKFNINAQGVRLVRGKNITTGNLRWGDDTRWWNDFSIDLSKYMLKTNDIVVGMDGSLVGKNYAKISENDLPLLLVQRVACIRAKEGYDQRFLWGCIASGNFERYIDSIKTGTSIPHISGGQIGNYLIPDFDFPTQKKIAAILSALEEKIAINRAINDNLLAQAQTLYKQFFPYGVQDDLPNGWRIGTVGEIIEIHDSKRIPLSGADRTKMEKKIYPYYGAASLMDFVDNYIFDGKYLLLGEDGTVVDDAGYPILQYVWGQFWVNNHAHILTGRLGFDVESLYMLFKQTPVKSIVTGAVQPKISQANLRSVQVVIPPEHNLREYNDLVEPLFSLFRANEEECKDLTALRDTLLPKLMSGEIDVSTVQL